MWRLGLNRECRQWPRRQRFIRRWRLGSLSRSSSRGAMEPVGAIESFGASEATVGGRPGNLLAGRVEPNGEHAKR